MLSAALVLIGRAKMQIVHPSPHQFQTQLFDFNCLKNTFDGLLFKFNLCFTSMIGFDDMICETKPEIAFV